MKSKIVTKILTLLVFLCEYSVIALSFPGPRVYVVTPSGRHLKKDEGKPMPFYYHNWMRRSDTVLNTTTTTTTTETSVPKVKTPDLIFAEFESDGSMQKSIRKLLEKERIAPRKTTMSPIYVPDEEDNKVTRVVNYGLPVKTKNVSESSTENVKYSFMSHDDYYKNVPSPVYVTSPPAASSSTTKKITTTPSPINIENIWHVIDNEKSNQYSNKWEEISLEPKKEKKENKGEIEHRKKIEDQLNHRIEGDENSSNQEYNEDIPAIDENFALPGFATNPGNGAENESRAIRTEQHMRFPYINLKPFQIKASQKPSLNNLSNGKKSNLFTNLDNFYDLKNPVRGEAQDIVPLPPHIDRYNPAQPYLPQQKYGSNLSKQSGQVAPSPKTTASLVPPPPPPPKSTGNDFPAPSSYESFPPYAPSAPDFGPVSAPAPPPSQPVSVSITPSISEDLTSDLETSGPSVSDNGPTVITGYRYKPPSSSDDTDTNVPMMNTGYQYKPPSIPMPYYPTSAPPSKPFQGYSYNKPSMTVDKPPMIAAEKPVFEGYHYNKPSSKLPVDNMPPSYGFPPSYGHDDFPPDSYEHDDSPPHIHEHDDSPPHIHDSDIPEFIYGHKPYDDAKAGDGMKDNDMDMMPPTPPTLHTDIKPGDYGPPPDDHGFPSDFPSDLHSDIDDHGHDHYHYHIIDTTTTTEMPRVNRFSYYYLGKKLYYLPLYFSVYFIVYVGALIIKAVLRHKIVYPNSWRPNTTTATFFSKRSLDEYFSHENLHELTKKVTHAIGTAAEKYMNSKNKIS